MGGDRKFCIVLVFGIVRHDSIAIHHYGRNISGKGIYVIIYSFTVISKCMLNFSNNYIDSNFRHFNVHVPFLVVIVCTCKGSCILEHCYWHTWMYVFLCRMLHSRLHHNRYYFARNKGKKLRGNSKYIGKVIDFYSMYYNNISVMEKKYSNLLQIQ